MRVTVRKVETKGAMRVTPGEFFILGEPAGGARADRLPDGEDSLRLMTSGDEVIVSGFDCLVAGFFIWLSGAESVAGIIVSEDSETEFVEII